MGPLTIRRSVRLRLLTLALLPLVVLLPVLLGVTMWRWIDKYDDLLISKVASDLRIAEQYFTAIEVTHATEVQALARSVAFAEARAQGPEAVTTLLTNDEVTGDLDFLVLQARDEPAAPEPFRTVAALASTDTPSAGLALLTADDLLAVGPQLSERARLDLVPTEAARVIDKTAETRGMVMLVTSPVPQSDQVLIGGRLLNRDLNIIDTMNALIYRERQDQNERIAMAQVLIGRLHLGPGKMHKERSRRKAKR